MNRKEEIIKAVIDIFKEQGVSGEFTMSALASKLDIGKSTIYEYFKTKDEILTEAILYMIEHSIEQLLSRETIEYSSFEESLKAELNYMFELAKESHLLVSALAPKMKDSISKTCRIQIQEKLGKVNQFYTSKFTSIFVKGYEEGVFSRVGNEYDEAMISAMIAGTVVMISNKYVTMFKDLDIEEYTQKMYNTILLILND